MKSSLHGLKSKVPAFAIFNMSTVSRALFLNILLQVRKSAKANKQRMSLMLPMTTIFGEQQQHPPTLLPPIGSTATTMIRQMDLATSAVICRAMFVRNTMPVRDSRKSHLRCAYPVFQTLAEALLQLLFAMMVTSRSSCSCWSSRSSQSPPHFSLVATSSMQRVCRSDSDDAVAEFDSSNTIYCLHVSFRLSHFSLFL